MAKVVLEFVFRNHKRTQEFLCGLRKGDNGFSLRDCSSSTYTKNLAIYYQDTDIKVCDALCVKLKRK